MTVRLIDNNFRLIETQKTTMDELKDFDQIKYKQWHAKYGIKTDLNDITWIEQYKKIIYDDTHNSPLKESSKRMHLESLARILLGINKSKHKKLAKQIFLEGIEIQNTINQEKENQIMDEDDKSKYTNLKTLRRIQECMPDTTKEDNMKKIAISLNVLIPPLRNNLNDMLIWTQEGKPPIDSNNYMIIRPDYVSYIINYDKVSKDGEQVELLFKDRLYMEGVKMANLMIDSLKRFPRKYVIENNKGAPHSHQSFHKMLQKAAERPINQNMLRKAYINYYYSGIQRNGFYIKMSIKEKTELAMYMRHTKSTAERNYEFVNV